MADSIQNVTLTGQDPEVPCKCVFACICKSTKGIPDGEDTPVPNDHCTLTKAMSNENKPLKWIPDGEDTPVPNDHCTSTKAISNENKPLKWSSSNSYCPSFIYNSNLPNEFENISLDDDQSCGSNNDTTNGSDDICHCCTLKEKRAHAHNSFDWALAGNRYQIRDPEDLEKYLLASSLFDHFCSKLKVKPEGRVQDMVKENYEQVLEIYLKVCSTEKELGKDDFVEITNILMTLKEKGILTEGIFLKFKRTMKENGYIVSDFDDMGKYVSKYVSEMNLKHYHDTLGVLPNFNTSANKFYDKFYSEMASSMKTEENRDKLPGVIFDKFIEPIDKADDIHSRINILHSLDFLVVMHDIEFLHKEDWLCKCDMSKYVEVHKLATDLNSQKVDLTKQMENHVEKLLDQLKITPDGYIKYDVEYRTYPMEAMNLELIGQRVCNTPRRGHNKPLCEICGVQNSWLKTFKKRGIRIKEADSSNNKRIWHNDTKDN